MSERKRVTLKLMNGRIVKTYSLGQSFIQVSIPINPDLLKIDIWEFLHIQELKGGKA